MQPDGLSVAEESPSQTQPQPIYNQPTGLGHPKKSHKRLLLIILSILTVLISAIITTACLWYYHQLSPLGTDKGAKITVNVVKDSSTDQIGQLLEKQKLIRSSQTFNVYTRISGARGKLQAGVYTLSPSSSVSEIVDTLLSGRADQFAVTFLPGATVAAAREVLVKAGYDSAEIDAALAKQYDHPIFTSKPETADLEGYIFGETYYFASGTSVESILTKTFDEFYAYIEENSLESAYQKQGFTLFEGITLASIIQREVNGLDDQKKAAQVFIKRLNGGMQLGSDATFIYAAEKMGVEPSVDLESDYNTRKYSGLTPGPISTPSKTALLSVAQPSDTNYLYFVNGDDGVNYFANTLEEHERNIVEKCAKNCNLF